jgi:ankyrin repeat protein
MAEQLLCDAICDGDFDAVQRCVANGQDVNRIAAAGGVVPLVLACRRLHVAIASFLLEAGADPNPKPTAGGVASPLFYAVSHGARSLPLADLLVAYGAIIEVRSFQVACIQQATSIVQLFVRAGYKMRALHVTPFMLFHPEVLEMLVQEGADCAPALPDGSTPIFSAAAAFRSDPNERHVLALHIAAQTISLPM